MRKGMVVGFSLAGSAVALAVATVTIVSIVGSSSSGPGIEVVAHGAPEPQSVAAEETAVPTADFLDATAVAERAGQDWVVPADAPWASFPIGGEPGDYCTPEQDAWLAEHGFPSKAEMRFTFVNTNTDGGAATVSEIRVASDETEPAVVVECPLRKGGEIPVQTGVLDTAVDRVAVFSEDLLEGSGGGGFDDRLTYGDPGTPIVLNLQPGEQAEVLLWVWGPTLNRGGLVATVHDGDDQYIVTILDPAVGTTVVPILAGPNIVTIRPDSGTLACATGRPSPDEGIWTNTTPCDLATAMTAIAALR